MKILFCFALCFQFFSSFGQERVSVEINLLFGGEKIELEKWYKTNENDSVLFESLRFYLSGFELTQQEKSVWQEKESYHLVDAEYPDSWKILLNPAKNSAFDGLKFHLGIDSLTNAGGIKGGELDPVKGMYWTWQTGYIHFKIEGKSNLCPTRNRQFSLHIGGFCFPDNTFQTIVIDHFDAKNPRIALDLKSFLNGIDLRTQNHVMSPGPQAVELSRQLAALFQKQ